MTGTAGASLYTQAWLPDGPPVGAVVLVHGLAEHSGRYAELVDRLSRQGYAVHALDHRGHGRSSGRRAAIGRFRYLVEDLGAFVAQVRQRYGGASVILLGHSLGGAVALDYALAHPDALRALVLSAPALSDKPAIAPLQLAVARLLSRILPNAGAIKLPAETISRDPRVVRDYEQDPLVYRGAVPARTAVELLDAMTRLATQAAGLRVPVLVLHGSGDALVPLASAEPVYAVLGGADKTVKRYAGLYHEVFHEPERAQVFADLDAWLAAHR
jgi:alpha-beta hydrolase superfamily lysophospholipase